jgi:hypothetical protein
MRRNEEGERLVKQEEIWDKENRLTKEEQVRSWTMTIEALEKIYKHFYSYRDYRLGKFKPKPVWICEWEYKDEDKEKSKQEVVRVLNLCKKEHLLINSPAIASLIYVNRLNKREAMEKELSSKKLSFKGNVWEDSSEAETNKLFVNLPAKTDLQKRLTNC